jgi:hypothetical protein
MLAIKQPIPMGFHIRLGNAEDLYNSIISLECMIFKVDTKDYEFIKGSDILIEEHITSKERRGEFTKVGDIVK